MLKITQKAAEKAKEVRSSEGFPETCPLRVSVIGGGCSGMQYDLQFAEDANKGDIIFGKDAGNEIDLITDPQSLLYLKGTEIDYKETMNQSGFAFNNPNERMSCGCGMSFTAEPQDGDKDE